MRSFELLIKYTLDAAKGLYFEMDGEGLIVLPWKNCIFGWGLFYYRYSRIPLPKFFKIETLARIPSILDPFLSLHRFESIDLRPFHDSILNLPFFPSK